MNREQVFLVLLVAVTGFASLLILLPFLEYVLGALLLGYVLRPVHRRLTPYLGQRLAAITAIAAGFVALVLPLAYISVVLYRDVRAFARGETELDLARIEADLAELTGRDVDVESFTGDVGTILTDFLFGSASELVGFTTTVLIGITVVVFLVYYVLLDGPAFVQWAVRVAPLDDAVAHRLAERMDRMTWGVVAGHIFVAVVQGLVGGIGLYVAGIPNVVFWTAVMIVTALLPIIGAFLVWGPASAYLYLIGDVGMATFLALWGLIVVSLVDNYLRSIAIDQSADVNPGVILIGVVGGIYTLGAVGLFVGPIVIGLFAATIRVFDEHYDALSYDTPPPDPPAQTRLSWLVTEPKAVQETTDDAAGTEGPDDAGGTLGTDDEDDRGAGSGGERDDRGLRGPCDSPDPQGSEGPDEDGGPSPQT